MSRRVILVWFRNDLRTSDNEVLYSAVEKSTFVIPVYIFDPRYDARSAFGFSNTGEIRKNYLIHTVAALKHKLQSLGGDLFTFEGYPEEIIPQLVQKYEVDEVYHHREVAQRETRISELVEESLWKLKRNLRHFIGHTMYHKEDLPFPIRDIPNDFNTFKKKVSKESFVRPCLSDITSISIPPHIEKTSFPYDMKFDLLQEYGEVAANNKLHEILNNTKSFEDVYTVLTPFLATGALSPSQAYHFFASKLNSQNKKMINTILEGLLWRDYYRFMLKKYPNCFFKTEDKPVLNIEVMNGFVQGNSPSEVVNEKIRRLNETGLLSREEREYLAYYFIYELKQHWLIGANYFEQQLLDYAPATNYGFWSHVAGCGTSSKNNKSRVDWEKIKESEKTLIKS